MDCESSVAFTENDLIGIQPETCLTPFFTGDLLRAIFNYEIPQATSILPLAEQAFQMNMYKIQNQQFFIYSTYEGLLHFVRTGRTDEIPEIFYHPLTIAQRIHVLNEVCKCCESGSFHGPTGSLVTICAKEVPQFSIFGK